MRNVASASLAVLLSGCVIIPVPVPSSQTLSEQKTKSLTLGKTTYSEVVGQFGIPDVRHFPGYVPPYLLHTDDKIDSAAVYRGKNWTLCVGWAVIAPNISDVDCIPQDEWNLQLGFDGYGVLVGYAAVMHDGGCWGNACPPSSPAIDHVDLANNEARLSTNEEILSPGLSKDGVIDKSKFPELSESERGGEGEEALRRYYNFVETDLAEAHQSLCKSADYGNTKAKMELARLYERGLEGLPRDPVMSLFWYRMSGYLDSEDIEYLDNQFSDHEVESTSRLLETWRTGDCEKLVRRQAKNNQD